MSEDVKQFPFPDYSTWGVPNNVLSALHHHLPQDDKADAITIAMLVPLLVYSFADVNENFDILDGWLNSLEPEQVNEFAAQLISFMKLGISDDEMSVSDLAFQLTQCELIKVFCTIDFPWGDNRARVLAAAALLPDVGEYHDIFSQVKEGGEEEQSAGPLATVYRHVYKKIHKQDPPKTGFLDPYFVPEL